MTKRVISMCIACVCSPLCFPLASASSAPVPLVVQELERAKKACADRWYAASADLYTEFLRKAGVPDPTSIQVECARKTLRYEYTPGGRTDYVFSGEDAFAVCCIWESDDQYVAVQDPSSDTFGEQYTAALRTIDKAYTECMAKLAPKKATEMTAEPLGQEE